MRTATIVSLGASAVLGLGALVVAKVMLPAPGAARAEAPAAGANAVTIVVATRDIKYGDRLTPGHLAVVSVPKTAAPVGAFSSVKQVLAQDNGAAPLALVPIAAREPLLPAKLSGPGARASIAAEIEEGKRAYTIRVTDVSGVGGHALPGDRVDVVLSRYLGDDEQKSQLSTEIVIQNVRVLGVDLNADLNSDKPATPRNATLEVTVEDAQKLALAMDLGTLSLALRGSGVATIEEVRPMGTRDVVKGPVSGAPARSGGGGGSRAPSKGSGVRAQAGPIIIIEGGGA